MSDKNETTKNLEPAPIPEDDTGSIKNVLRMLGKSLGLDRVKSLPIEEYEGKAKAIETSLGDALETKAIASAAFVLANNFSVAPRQDLRNKFLHGEAVEAVKETLAASGITNVSAPDMTKILNASEESANRIYDLNHGRRLVERTPPK